LWRSRASRGLPRAAGMGRCRLLRGSAHPAKPLRVLPGPPPVEQSRPAGWPVDGATRPRSPLPVRTDFRAAWRPCPCLPACPPGPGGGGLAAITPVYAQLKRHPSAPTQANAITARGRAPEVWAIWVGAGRESSRAVLQRRWRSEAVLYGRGRCLIGPALLLLLLVCLGGWPLLVGGVGVIEVSPPRNCSRISARFRWGCSIGTAFGSRLPLLQDSPADSRLSRLVVGCRCSGAGAWAWLIGPAAHQPLARRGLVRSLTCLPAGPAHHGDGPGGGAFWGPGGAPGSSTTPAADSTAIAGITAARLPFPRLPLLPVLAWFLPCLEDDALRALLLLAGAAVDPAESSTRRWRGEVAAPQALLRITCPCSGPTCLLCAVSLDPGLGVFRS